MRDSSRPKQYAVSQDVHLARTPLPKPLGTLPLFFGCQNCVVWLLSKNHIRVELRKAVEDPEM